MGKTELSDLFNRVEGVCRGIASNLMLLCENYQFLLLQKERVIGLGFLTMIIFLRVP